MYYFRFFIISFSLIFYSYSFTEDKKPQNEPVDQPITEKLSQKDHTITIHGNPLDYSSEAGNILLKDNEGKTKASIFYIAYTKKDSENLPRPLTFCFNGGPGSSSVWLHFGVFGPKRVALSDNGVPLVPIHLENNEHTLLDVTDLVFIDPVSTGYSRTANGEDPKQFHGYEEDIKSIGEFIRLYTTRNNRWTSPLYLAGESYGTTRAAGLAEYLHEDKHMDIDGLILISTALNFQTLTDWQKGNDLPYLLFLPSYTTTAWYHGKLSPKFQNRSLEDLLSEVELFVQDDYSQALFKGSSLSKAEREKTIHQLSAYTGLSKEFIDGTNLRINIHQFTKELLRSEKRTIGRFDSRLKGIDQNSVSDTFDYDPSIEFVIPAFTAASNHYMRTELGIEDDAEYKVFANVWPWNYGKAQNQYLNVGEDLRDVMTKNSRLQVFVASGYYDLATPYFATDYTLNHLNLDATLQHHITQKRYEGGHMMYFSKPTLSSLKQDLTQFFQSTQRYQQIPLH